MNTTVQAYSNVWQDCLSSIKEQTSEDEFIKWFKPLVAIGYDGTTLQLRVPNENYVRQIEGNYLSFLKPILHQMFGAQTRLRYITPRVSQAVNSATVSNTTENGAINKFVAQTDTANIKNPFVIPGVRRPIVDSQLNFNYTFGTHIEGECNRLARSAGYAIAVTPGKTAFNPLYIFGNSGLGKTHIIQAIGMEVKQRHPGMQVLYVSMSKFQAQFTSAMLNSEYNDFIQFYQMIDVLIIDDIQELSGKKKTQDALFNIFNHLHLSGKQLILTSDKPPVELKDMNERLLTRFKWGLTAELIQPDFETKTKIITNKAAKLKTELSKDVIDFLANNISANIREIEGALSSLVAHASFLNKKITISLAKEVLKVYVKYTQQEITIERIQEVVCEHFNITIEKLNSPTRTRDIAQARQIAMYLSKQHTKASLALIGATIGGKNHATVLHAHKTVTNFLENDKAFKQQFEDIERKLLAK